MNIKQPAIYQNGAMPETCKIIKVSQYTVLIEVNNGIKKNIPKGDILEITPDPALLQMVSNGAAGMVKY